MIIWNKIKTLTGSRRKLEGTFTDNAGLARQPVAVSQRSDKLIVQRKDCPVITCGVRAAFLKIKRRKAKNVCRWPLVSRNTQRNPPAATVIVFMNLQNIEKSVYRRNRFKLLSSRAGRKARRSVQYHFPPRYKHINKKDAKVLKKHTLPVL